MTHNALKLDPSIEDFLWKHSALWNRSRKQFNIIFMYSHGEWILIEHELENKVLIAIDMPVYTLHKLG